MEFIAVDVGTSFIKAAIVDPESLQIRNIARRPSPARLPNADPDIYEVPPEQCVARVRELIHELLAATDDCHGILMCGQMGGLILCDESGQPLTPFISWQDRRATRLDSHDISCFQRLTDLVGQRAQTVLGNEFRPGLNLSLLYYLDQTDQLPQRHALTPVTLPDFVTASLCSSRPVTELTNSPGIISITDASYPVDLLTELGVGDLNWPQLVDFRHRVGECRVSGESLPVYAATGDHQCSLAGTLVQPDELSINISTGSQVSLLTNDVACGEFQVRPFFDGMWLKTISNIPAGRALTAILRLLTELSSNGEPDGHAWDEFFKAAESTPSTNVRINLGLFPGAIPGPGFIGNLSEDNLTVGHVARACLEQMASQYKQLAQRLETPQTWKRIAFSGGLAQKSVLLRDLVSAALDTEYRVAASTEDSLLGMLVLGRVIAGLDDTVAAASRFVARQLS